MQWTTRERDWVEVESHSLTEDGVIEEYYVEHKGESVTIQANEVTEAHGGKHEHEPKEKKKKQDATDGTKYQSFPKGGNGDEGLQPCRALIRR
mgnify:CR=1 FL=1